MGSVVMEPDDIVTYAGTSNLMRNFTTICTSVGRINSKGVFFRSNPLHYSAPLLMVQLALATAIILLLSKLLRPLGQPILVSQILGGIILGPSLLGRSEVFTKRIFPLRSFIVLDTLSIFGYMFYFFLIGVRIDPWMLKKIEKRTFVIGLSTVVVSLMLSMSSAFIIPRNIRLDPTTAKSLPAVAVQESVIGFPVIAQYLTELKIINSEFGRVALSSSIVSNLLSFCIITFTILSQETNANQKAMLTTVATGIVVAVAIIFILRPIILWLMKLSPPGEPLREDCIYAVFVSVLMTGFICQATGLNILYGPLVFGMALPAGPPLGSALAEKLDHITYWIFMPLFFVKNGLVMNIFGVIPKGYMAVQIVILAACAGKVLGALLPSLCYKMPARDAVALALVMTVQGVLELGMFKMMKKAKAINNEAFVVMCTSMLIVTMVVTPIIKHLYDPSRRYAVYRARTVQHSNGEFRALVCIHDQESVPVTINLLEALGSTEENPTTICVLHLIELVGRAAPILIAHKMNKRPSTRLTPSDQIINAFRYYEQSNRNVTVHPFTATSSYATMHDDVCTVSLDRKISLIIIPFHQRFTTADALQSSKKGIKTMSRNVIDKAPCSVAILVDRGLFNISKSVLESSSPYRVAVLFLGGADDREALALAIRMAEHPNINLTTIRLLENGNITSYNMRERNLDNEVVSEFRTSMAGNYRVMYIEEVVIDGSGTIAVIRSMEESYELIIVGRRHDKDSLLLSGITEWKEHEELGAIGDMLVAADFRGNTSVLVVQQHTNVANKHHEKQTENPREQSFKITGEMTEEEAEEIPIQRRYMQ